MLRATTFYPPDNYQLDNEFIQWIGPIHWITYPPFVQPAPGSSKISEVTIEFLVLQIGRDEPLISPKLPCQRCQYHVLLEIVFQKEVFQGDWPFFVSYSFQSPIRIIILTDDF